jgi:glycosyltransferase involved in cell wall biosynthesis
MNRGNDLSILLICQSYPPVIGGSEIEAQRVSEALIKRGYSVQVVCAGGDPMPNVTEWIDPKGIPVRIYSRHLSGTLRDLIFALRVAGMLWRDRNNYQVVYFLMQGLHLALGLPVARMLGKPIVMKISSSLIVPTLDLSCSGRLELRWLKKWARRVMILNDQVRQQLIERGFSPEKLMWMPNPVNTEEFVPADDNERADLRRKFGIPAESLVVLYCGRLVKVKALPSLLDAFALVVCKFPHAKLVLIGDGPLRTELTEQVDRLQLGERNVRFVGRVDPSEIPSWSKIADVFTLVSYSEGFSCALTEAMSAGLACVVSDIPANRQLITAGEEGLLVPVDDVEAISGAMAQLLGDAPLRMRMGNSSRKKVLDHYSVSRVTDRYAEMFREQISR